MNGYDNTETPKLKEDSYDAMGFPRGVAVAMDDGRIGWALSDELEDPNVEYHEALDEIPYYVEAFKDKGGCDDVFLPPGVQVLEFPMTKKVDRSVTELAISRANTDRERKYMSGSMCMMYTSDGECCMVHELDEEGALGCSTEVGVMELRQLIRAVIGSVNALEGKL